MPQMVKGYEIDIIEEYLELGYDNTLICKIMKVSRNTVCKIRNGKYVRNTTPNNSMEDKEVTVKRQDSELKILRKKMAQDNLKLMELEHKLREYGRENRELKEEIEELHCSNKLLSIL